MNNLILLNNINKYFEDFIDKSDENPLGNFLLFGDFTNMSLMFDEYFQEKTTHEVYDDILSFDLTILKDYNNFLEQSIFVIEILIKNFDILNKKYTKILFHDGSKGVFYNIDNDEVYYGRKQFGPSMFNLEVERVEVISDLAKEQKF